MPDTVFKKQGKEKRSETSKEFLGHVIFHWVSAIGCKKNFAAEVTETSLLTCNLPPGKLI